MKLPRKAGGDTCGADASGGGEERLTTAADWERRYTSAAASSPARAQSVSLLRQLIPDTACKSYSEELLWSRLLPRFISRRPEQLILEIGCAPGGFLRTFEQNFGCVPHGIDFSSSGLRETRDNFRAWGYDPENIIQGDVLDPVFRRDSCGKFDVVFSRGFIEHFTGQLPAVIQAHVDAVRPGGLLLITIPNYHGLNYALGLLTVRYFYPEHNFTIMHPQRFCDLFAMPQLEMLWCGHLGGFDLGLIDDGSSRKTLRVARRLQGLFNVAFRAIPPPESRWTSPHLVYVGRKLAFNPPTKNQY